MAERRREGRDPVLALAGAAALTGGMLWTVKAATVLATGDQPAHLFEVAPAAQGLALALLVLGPVTSTAAATRLAGVAAGLLGASAGAAYVTMREHIAFNALFFLANLFVVVGAYLVGRAIAARAVLGKRSGVLRGIGIWTIPAVLTGGLLAQWNERLLELPLLVLGLAWVLVGALCLTRRREPRGGSRESPPMPCTMSTS